jgi:hypothetical protein
MEDWVDSKTAGPLALGFGGTYNKISDRVGVLSSSVGPFPSTFKNFKTLLEKRKRQVQHFEIFLRTLDECHDFLYDFFGLKNGTASFGKRLMESPNLTYRVPRYVYTSAEILGFENRSKLLLNYMHAKINHLLMWVGFVALLVGTAFSDILDNGRDFFIQTTNRYVPSLENGHSKNLDPLIDQLQEKSAEPDDVKSLYLKIDRIEYFLKRTGPQHHSNPPDETVTFQYGHEIQKVREALRKRFEDYQASSGELPRLETHSLTDKQLGDFWYQRVRTLEREYLKLPEFTIRRRIFSVDEAITEMRNASFSLPPPAMTYVEPHRSVTL